ncbi:hypothetical protein SAMN05518683_11042 [Salibacterium halotolerans]|uniref:Uncharacterized protein n=1 Tax=Salibacterium halotolerans TaxID=1884432 RepID=A0A1I5T7M6_9BACI|nr:hypothetical protein SAMN05518683_11042 [Salibacterium halotolerans]
MESMHKQQHRCRNPGNRCITGHLHFRKYDFSGVVHFITNDVYTYNDVGKKHPDKTSVNNIGKAHIEWLEQ